MSGRRDRSRSPTRVDSHGHRRDSRSDAKNEMNQMMNPMMMANMYPQGNMMMAGGMYPNMMMQNMMGNGMIASTGMEMMQGNGMDLVAQPTMDMSAMATPAIPATPAQPMDMGMMGSMMMDPTMMMYNMANTEMAVVPENKEITLKYCKLTPPDPNTPSPPRRDRPPGCRTIFVGGLPDKIRESIVRDIFEPYGRIHTLRLSKKNFCHIRFDRENSVDPAMLLSGYRIKITGRDKDKDDKEEDDDSHATTGWLHVDFALSRDDQNEYERKQRQALRQQQSQLQQMAPQVSLQQTYRKSPSPVRIQPFSNTAIIQLSEKVKSEDSFSTTLPTLISWLERGECSKKNSNQFYSMIQATNSHIRRLFNEKMQVEEELQECRERTKNHIAKVIEQLEQVAKVFVAATHQRVWDHFTKPQRKNIETWQKMTQDFNTLKEEFLEKFNDEVNEYDYNNGYNNKPLDMNSKSNEEVLQLKSENESLQFQLMAYKNEVDVIKADAQKEMEKFKAQFIARQALQGAMDSKSMQPPLPQPVLKPPPPPPLPDDMDSKVLLKESVEAGCGEAKLIGVISAFLQVHPHGASLDYVVSYVRALFPHSTQATIHHVLQKHNDVFQLTTSGVGANIENKWSFVAFTSKSETATQAV